jgi:hypothetical protein
MVLDFAPADDSRRADALALILSQARRRDALTLWHLLTRGTEADAGVRIVWRCSLRLRMASLVSSYYAATV